MLVLQPISGAPMIYTTFSLPHVLVGAVGQPRTR